jgi:hypothetical protein
VPQVCGVIFFDKSAAIDPAEVPDRRSKYMKFMTFFTLARRMHCLARRPSLDQLVSEMKGL